MTNQRVFQIAHFLQPAAGEPLRSVITESADAAVVAWHVQPGQRITPHIHPHGQDTWTLMAGQGDYQVDATGTTVPVAAGDVVVAPVGAVHGVLNTGTQPLIFVSVVSPALSGYELLK
jgi:quercetin dioxygenase-like cupin family protein